MPLGRRAVLWESLGEYDAPRMGEGWYWKQHPCRTEQSAERWQPQVEQWRRAESGIFLR